MHVKDKIAQIYSSLTMLCPPYVLMSPYSHRLTFTNRRIFASIPLPRKIFNFFPFFSKLQVTFFIENRCAYRGTDRSGEVVVDTIGREKHLAAKPCP